MSLQLLPGRSAIGRTIKSAARTTAREIPRLTAHLVERGEQRVRIVRIENNIDRAGVFVLAQDLGPRLAAIGRAENSAIGIRPIGVPDGSHENDVRIIRMDDERADMASIFQADVVPIAAAIDGLINAIAVGDVAAQRRPRLSRRRSCCDRSERRPALRSKT